MCEILHLVFSTYKNVYILKMRMVRNEFHIMQAFLSGLWMNP